MINLQLKGKLYPDQGKYPVQSRSDTNDTFRNNPLVQLILPQGEMRLIQGVDDESVDSMVTQAVQDGADTRQGVEDVTGESKETVTLSLRRLKKAKEIQTIGAGKSLEIFPSRIESKSIRKCFHSISQLSVDMYVFE